MGAGKVRPLGGRVAAVAAALVTGLAALAAGDTAFAVGGSAVTSETSYGYVVKVNVGNNRGCTGVRLEPQLVATAKECFVVGGVAPVTGPAPAGSTVTPRPKAGAPYAPPVAVDHLFVRDDRNLVLAHLATAAAGVWGDAKVATTAPAPNETLRVLGYGRTATEWTPDQPHTAQYSVQTVSATGLGIVPSTDGTICKGDGGGPLVRENADGTVQLAALVDTSWQGGCYEAAGTRRDATATRVDDLGGWINQYRQTSLLGIVEAGNQSGCLNLRVGTSLYSLAGGDAAVLTVGTKVSVGGYQAPVPSPTCTQGIRFQVTSAKATTTITGTVGLGPENCVRLSYNGTGQTLIGGDPAIVKKDAKVTLIGYPVEGLSGYCAGPFFAVVAAIPAKVVSIRARINNQIVTADNAGASPLIANRTAVGPWEVFDQFDLGEGNIALRAGINTKYVSADNAGASPLIANRTVIGAWETFQLITNTDGSISLKAKANGMYVTAENAGAGALIANRTEIGAWERFDIIVS
jgi:hypothetical protein